MTIYCEGRTSGFDEFILQKITEGLDVVIHPIGGTHGAKEAIETAELTAKSITYFFFRDRDFDVAVSIQPSLTRVENTIYSYRTTVENYLLNPNCFYNFLQEKKCPPLRRSPLGQYKRLNQGDVHALFTKTAQQIAYYQALRHTMGKLRNAASFETTWLSQGSGHLPTGKELDNKPLCRQKALDKLKASKQETDVWTEQDFDDISESFYHYFEQANFYRDERYLIWFQGKDFAKALGLMLPQFPMKHYYRFAKKHFDYRVFEDLVELRNVINYTRYA